MIQLIAFKLKANNRVTEWLKRSIGAKQIKIQDFQQGGGGEEGGESRV